MANDLKPFPHQLKMQDALATFRNAADQLRETLALVEGRIPASFIGPTDDEICYTELWLRQVRDRLKEIDKTVGHLKGLNGKRALHNWFTRDEVTRMYGYTFRLDFHLIPSLPKAKTKERGLLVDWLIKGERMDCLVMDEHSGDWVFDFDKMEQLVNAMAKEGQRIPDAMGVTLHPNPKIIVRAEK